MFIEQGHSRKSLGTHDTGVLFDGSVRLLMRPQIAAVSKASVTIRAVERFFSGVGTNMPLEEPGSREGLATHVTLARQCVGTDVHFEGTARCVGFVASGARVSAYTNSDRTVELLVLGETGLGCVRFATVCASVASFAATTSSTRDTSSR